MSGNHLLLVREVEWHNNANDANASLRAGWKLIGVFQDSHFYDGGLCCCAAFVLARFDEDSLKTQAGKGDRS